MTLPTTMPGFTAEIAVGRSRRAYRPAAGRDRAAAPDSLSPADINCGSTSCTCTGLLDCIDMLELSELCAPDAHMCSSSGGLTCGCARH